MMMSMVCMYNSLKEYYCRFKYGILSNQLFYFILEFVCILISIICDL